MVNKDGWAAGSRVVGSGSFEDVVLVRVRNLLNIGVPSTKYETGYKASGISV